jgi:hypothetical protein
MIDGTGRAVEVVGKFLGLSTRKLFRGLSIPVTGRNKEIPKLKIENS